MFTNLPDLPDLSQEVKKAIRQGKYRLLRYGRGYVLMMGEKVFELSNTGAFVRSMPFSDIPSDSFKESLAFDSFDLGEIKKVGLGVNFSRWQSR